MKNNNGINVPIGASTKDLKTDLDNAVSILKDGGQKMSDAVAQTGAKSSEGLKSLQQAYRATYKDAQLLAQMQGTSSAAFQEAAKKAAEYKDTLEDVQDAIKAASPEQRWKVVGQAIQGAAQVAQGFVGTMELIGVETKDAEKAIAQMMALQGISNAISGIFQLKDAFVALNAATQASVIGIGLMAAAWVVYNLSTEDAAAANKKFADSAKAIEEAELKIQNIMRETQSLRVKAMKDGKEKELAQAELAYKNDLDALTKAYQDRTISQMTYQQRSNYLFQAYQNQLTNIQKKGEEDRAQKIWTKKPIEIKNTRLGSSKDAEGGFQSAMSNIIQGSTDEGWAKINAANLKGMATWEENFDGFIGKVDEVSKEIELKMRDLAMPMIDAIDSMVNAAMSGGDIGRALASSLLSSMGDFMKKWGAQLILVGLGAETLKLSLASLNGIPAIAAGAALVAAGSVATNMAKNFAQNQSTSSGGYSGGSYGGGYMGQNYSPESIQVGGIVRGSDLQIVLVNANNQTRRVR